MVNSREVLKSNVEADLRKKIQCAQVMLGELRGAVEKVEQNSTKAKCEVNQAVDTIQQAVGNRKLELTRQIDIMCHTQINSLQEEIQATYIALGSLQSTLSNLDSFDHSQLLNLHVPDVSRNFISTPSPVEVNVNNDSVEKSIRNWGAVNSKGLKGLFDVGMSASLPQRFVEYGDGKIDQGFMCHKPVSSDSNSLHSYKGQPKLPYGKNSEDLAKLNVSFGIQDSFSIEEWLSGVKLQTCPENEDFEIVSIEPTTNFKMSAEAELSTFKSGDDGASSIICLDNEESNTDLSKWLKPRKKPDIDIEQQCSAAYAHNPLKNRFIDFPCLRVDQNTWVKSKRSKSSIIGSQLSCASDQKGILPPEYSLPVPYWLKKHC